MENSLNKIQKEYQDIADQTFEKMGLIQRIPLRIKDTKTGRANPKYITIPEWILTVKDVNYQIYYIVHEVCHYLAKGQGHNNIFKYTEIKALEFWGLTITYRKAYAKTINGQPSPQELHKRGMEY